MRTTFLITIALIAGLMIFIAQGGREQRPVLWNPFTTAEAASGPERRSASAPADIKVDVQDLEAEAEVYDEQADEIQAQVMKYKREIAAITPLMDTKGFRRSSMQIAAAFQSKAVAELRQLAAQYQSEAKRLVAKTQAH